MPKCFYLYWKFINRHVKEALILKGETFLYNMFSKGKFELKVAQVFNKRSLFFIFSGQMRRKLNLLLHRN